MLRNKSKGFTISLTVMLFLSIGSLPVFGQDKRQVFDVITINSAITPAVSKYILRSIDQSLNSGSDGLIILLDTPGGLDTAMRDIAKGLLNSPMPVIVFVSPAGARAASAGVIITMSAHVAAMAPGTNIGAAHPVALGLGGKMDETMARKVENDFVAYARGIANKRGRDTKWVELAIRKSESITAEEALKQNVIDFVAVDTGQLLEKMNGKEIILSSGKVTLKTKGAALNRRGMGLREKILIALSNPNIAYLLLMIGFAGLYFEFAHPGAILPGVVGGISLILSFYALQTLPVNYAGILLIIFGIILFIAEIKIISHGMLTVAGVISLVLGSIMLFESPSPALRVSLSVMIPTVVIVSLFFAGVIAIALKAQIRRPVTGLEGMIDEEGYAITPVHTEGKVFVRGEYWNAFSQESLEKGKKIRVIEVNGLKVEVEEVKKEKEREG